jgi:uncharacterized protein YbjQ (UPF0145 family)
MTRPFSSSLSVPGLLGVRASGLKPIGQVQGSSVYRIGLQRLPRVSLRRSLEPMPLESSSMTPQSGPYMPRGSETALQALNQGIWTELERATEAHNEARALALSRLEDAAREMGATAIADVRLRRGDFAPAVRTIEFTAVGTALAGAGIEPSSERIPVTTLSGSEFWKLVSTGYWPVGLVGGTSVVYVISGTRTKRVRFFRFAGRSLWNQEYEDYTSGLLFGRTHAMGRLRHEALAVGAEGVLAIELDHRRRERSRLAGDRKDDLVLEVDALGTAVAPLEGRLPFRTPKYALDLGAQ